jgi:hypothetical protein
VIYFVCERCQKRLNRHFEIPAINLLKPMIAGQPITLSPEQQTIVASWVAKTGLLRLLKDAEHPKIAPNARLDRREHALRNLREVIKDLKPPANSFIRLGRYDWSASTDPTPLPERTYIPSSPLPRMDAAGNGGAGHLYWELFLGRPDRLARIEQGMTSTDWHSRIWPPQVGPLQWPPARALSPFDLAITTMLLSGTGPPGAAPAIADLGASAQP